MPELKTERIQVLWSPAELAEIDDWRFAHRISSRGEAIRQLVRLGLEASKAERNGKADKGRKK